MLRFTHFLVLAVAVLLVAPVSYAVPVQYTANLSGPNEAPPVNSPGIGTALVEIDTMAHTLHVNVTFSGLTSGVTAAHIHCCVAPPGTVGVATTTPTFTGFPSGVTSGTYDRTFDTTQTSSFSTAFINANGGTPAGAEAALAAGLAAGQAYFNIHTTNFGGGEIRGFLQAQAIPEPGTLGLFTAGLLGLVALARKRRS